MPEFVSRSICSTICLEFVSSSNKRPPGWRASDDSRKWWILDECLAAQAWHGDIHFQSVIWGTR
jgi:hypothetical protein